MKKNRTRGGAGILGWLWIAMATMAACGGDDFYEPCSSVDDCNPPEGTEAACVDDEAGGFCAWLCDTDDECELEELDDEYSYVCASFEENPDKYCFPGCEGGEACPDGFECRSTGGGVNQRRVCFPN